MTNATIYSIIPARSGSKGIPQKNIRPLKGIPLIAYSIKASLRSTLIQRTIVSTDSEDIASIAREYGAEVPFLRPAAISGDGSTDFEFVTHALDWFKEKERRVPAYIVHLRPTTPLRDIALVDSGIEKMTTDEKATALRSVHEMTESAYKCFEMDDGFLKSIGTGSFQLDPANVSRQQFPKTYRANGYVDVLRTSFVLERGKLHGDRVVGYVTPFVVDVDSLDDFEFLEYEISKDKRIFNVLFE